MEINGLEEITGTWTEDGAGSGIYKMNITQEVAGIHPGFLKNCFQVFVDRKPMVDARYPNCGADEFFTRKGWEDVDLVGKFSREDLEGAMIQLNLMHQFFSDVWKNSWKDDYYYLLGKKVFLDDPGEYFFDTLTNDLYVIPPAGVDLNQSRVEIRKRAYGMDGVVSYTDINHISFFGCGLKFENPSEHLVINGVTMRYPKYQRAIAEAKRDYLYPEGEIKLGINGRNFTVFNTYMSHAVGAGFGAASYKGSEYSTVTNCIFHDVAPSGSLTEKALSVYTVTGIADINRVTVFNTGNVGMHLFGVKKNGGRFLCRYSEVYNSGMLSHDVTSVYTGNDAAYGGRISHNWIHDNHAVSGPNAIRADGDGLGLTVDHNVIWDIGNTPPNP